MNTAIIAQQPLTGQQVIEQHGTDTLELPMVYVNSHPVYGSSGTPKVGDRYVAIHRQGPFGSPAYRDEVTADIINPANPGHLGTDPEPGRQWGWDDEDDSYQFIFTVVGVYILDSITPNMADLTFAASFHRAPQEVTA